MQPFETHNTNLEDSHFDLAKDPLEAIKYICNIRQSVFGFDYLKELMGRFLDLYGLE